MQCKRFVDTLKNRKGMALVVSILKNRKGMALIMVISLLALMVILVSAMFVQATNEYTAQNISRAQTRAQNLADTAINLVIGQVRESMKPTGSQSDWTGGTPVSWASQPGAQRKYQDGIFKGGYCLYSDSNMVVTGGNESGFASNATVPVAWNTNFNQYVDLNFPLFKKDSGGTTISVFPIFDPSATALGFDQMGIATGGVASQTKKDIVPTNYANQLPMPVQWLYQLADGTLGTVDTSGKFTSTSNSQPDPVTNPIVGRVAFWADDESSKLNVNTASEPTYWAQPNFNHIEDYFWAMSPPAQQEWQRYPGHPATVALSPVLTKTPVFTFKANGNGEVHNELTQVPDIDFVAKQAGYLIRNDIAMISPRVKTGGSYAGTVFIEDSLANPPTTYITGHTLWGQNSPLWTLNNGTQPSFYSAIDDYFVGSTGSRTTLYPTVDDMIFGSAQAKGVTPYSKHNTMSGKISMTPDKIRLWRGFLTTNSRAPETTLYGTPRIATWPIQSDPFNNPTYLTTFDKYIALCGTVGGNPYYFTRDARNFAGSTSPLNDISLPRNIQLLNYLDGLSNYKMPDFQSSSSGSLSNKYSGGGARQILTEMFDYIRSTNTVDTSLAYTPTLIQKTGTNYTAYTPIGQPSINVAASPGSGMVAASSKTWSDGVTKTNGFGRWFTFSEIALHFICCADGNPDIAPDEYYAYNPARQFFGYIYPPTTPKNAISSGVQAVVGDFTQGPGNGTIPNGFPVSNGTWRVKNPNPIPNTNYFGFPSGNIAASAPFKSYQTFFGNGTQNLDKAGGACVVGNVAVNDGGNQVQIYYSNFPPLSSNGSIYPGLPTGSTAADVPGTSYPGNVPANWNYCLDIDKPLPTNIRRIQATVLLEPFCASLGYPLRQLPDNVDILFSNMQNIQIIDKSGTFVPLFPQSNYTLKRLQTFRSVGGTTIDNNRLPVGVNAGSSKPQQDPFWYSNTTPISRLLPPIPPHPGDPKYPGPNNEGSYEILSNYIDIDMSKAYAYYGATSPHPTMKVGATGPITITIQVTPPNGSPQTVQTINAYFPSSANPATASNVPVPRLNSIYSPFEPTKEILPQTNPRTYTGTVYSTVPINQWSFHTFGSFIKDNGPGHSLGRFGKNEGFQIPERIVLGRAVPSSWAQPTPYFDSFLSSIPWHGDYRLVAANTNVDGDNSCPTIFNVPTTSTNPLTMTTIANANKTVFVPHRMSVQPLGATTSPYKLFPAVTPQPLPWTAGNPYTATQPAITVDTYNSASGNLFRGGHNMTQFGGQDFSNTVNYTGSGANSISTFLANFSSSDITSIATINAAIAYAGLQTIDIPRTLEAFTAIQQNGDFDSAVGPFLDGSLINEPDEGNRILNTSGTNSWNGYFYNYIPYFTGDDWTQVPTISATYFAPNRMIPSAGIMGSLPTGIKDGTPWRTLLFRPDISDGSKKPRPLGAKVPKDHLFLDWFWMPVVEPYGLSESLSTAGKVNVNYHMLPFDKNIQRRTALYGLLMGEAVTAMPNVHAGIMNTWNQAKAFQGTLTSNVNLNKAFTSYPPTSSYLQGILFTAGAAPGGQGTASQWHYDVDIYNTLNGLDVFNGMATQYGGKLFGSDSQICEMHILPLGVGIANAGPFGASTLTTLAQSMWDNFWSYRLMTGDNLRERPYARLLSKVTTRTNSWTVHYRAQAISIPKSAYSGGTVTISSSTPVNVLSEYRGSAIVERYIDPTDTNIPDYGGNSSPLSLPPIDKYSRFRVIQRKRFE